jgi:hypothetical protein
MISEFPLLTATTSTDTSSTATSSEVSDVAHKESTRPSATRVLPSKPNRLLKRPSQETRAGPKYIDPVEEFFYQQTKLFRHLERRFDKFQKRHKEDEKRAKAGKLPPKSKKDTDTRQTTDLKSHHPQPSARPTSSEQNISKDSAKRSKSSKSSEALAPTRDLASSTTPATVLAPTQIPASTMAAPVRRATVAMVSSCLPYDLGPLLIPSPPSHPHPAPCPLPSPAEPVSPTRQARSVWQ